MEFLKFYSPSHAFFAGGDSPKKAQSQIFLNPKLRIPFLFLVFAALLLTASAQVSPPKSRIVTDPDSISFSYTDLKTSGIELEINAGLDTEVHQILVSADVRDVYWDVMQVAVNLEAGQDWGKNVSYSTNLEGELLRVIIVNPDGIQLRAGPLFSLQVSDSSHKPVPMQIERLGGIVIVDNIMGKAPEVAQGQVAAREMKQGFFLDLPEYKPMPQKHLIYNLEGREVGSFDSKSEDSLAGALRPLPPGVYILIDPRNAEAPVRKIFKQ